MYIGKREVVKLCGTNGVTEGPGSGLSWLPILAGTLMVHYLSNDIAVLYEEFAQMFSFIAGTWVSRPQIFLCKLAETDCFL